MSSSRMVPFNTLAYGARFKYSKEEAAQWVKIGHDTIAAWSADKVSDSWVGQPVCSFTDDGDVAALVFLVAEDDMTQLQTLLERYRRQLEVEREFKNQTYKQRDALKIELTQARALPQIDPIALRRLLSALIGPAHHIRELQVCQGLPDNPIDQVLRDFNKWADLAAAAASSEDPAS